MRLCAIAKAGLAIVCLAALASCDTPSGEAGNGDASEQDAETGGAQDYCLANQCFAAPPTGQTKCYDNSEKITCPADRGEDFWGQDAQFATPRTLACTSGDCGSTPAPVAGDVVTDSSTGLAWQRVLPTLYGGCTGGTPAGSECQWQEAMDYCAGLDYGGHLDWRLPNPFELASILDNQRSFTPCIDISTFHDTPSKSFWSSSTGSGGNAFYVHFDFGEVTNTSKDVTAAVRCVRSETPSVDPFTGSAARYVVTEPVSGQQVVKDAITGLTWQGNLLDAKNWQQALQYCATLNHGGFADWRLPNRNELMSLVSYSRYLPASDFPGMPTGIDDALSHWSSSSSIIVPGAWTVAFNFGNVLRNVKISPAHVRCVRP
jgi:hypothetical protein